METLWQEVDYGILKSRGNSGFRAVAAFGIALGFAPGVQAATSVTVAPFGNGAPSSTFSIEGRAATEGGDYRVAQIQNIGRGYFRLLRIPLLGGREFNDGDGIETVRVAVISSTLSE